MHPGPCIARPGSSAAEQRTYKPTRFTTAPPDKRQVAGSNPASGTTFHRAVAIGFQVAVMNYSKPTAALRRCFLLLLLSAAPLSAWACVGRVVGVTDGDTIKVLCGQTELKVRLAQIDAPERGQAFGAKAKEALSDLVFEGEVRLDLGLKDRYGRDIATVWRGRLDINREMVRLGFAWAYRKYLEDQSLLEVEAAAKAAKRGLWRDAEVVPPWDYRRRKRSR